MILPIWGLACVYEWSNDDVNLILEAFQKVWNNLEELKNL